MDTYLIKYLRDNADTELSSKYIDFFKTELDWHIYNSEKNISKVYHRDNEKNLKLKLIHTLQYSIALLQKTKSKPDVINVLSTVGYLDKNALYNEGIELYSPVWNAVGKRNIFGDLETTKWHFYMQNLIRKKDFYQLLDLKLHECLEDFQKYLTTQYLKKDFRALLLYTDQYFYSKFSIEIFKKIGKPSIVFSHGLPGMYTTDAENRSDYLMVWSEKIKQNYLDVGFNADKVKVIGNSKYRKVQKNKEIKSDLSDILIVPVSSVLWHQHEYDSTVLVDKSMVVLYLYKVQSVLKKIGIKQVRYRTHPSIDKKWVHAFLDQDFFKIDNQNLDDSLKRSSIVIGATSTVLLESLIHGVNYIVFEPKNDHNINMAGFKLVPPFDGSEKKVITVKDEEELLTVLKENLKTEYSLIHDYIQDFDLSVLKELIK